VQNLPDRGGFDLEPRRIPRDPRRHAARSL